MSYIFWIVALVIFIIAEALTVGLISIWFVIGSIFAMLAAFLGGSSLLQVAVFVLVSAFCLIIFLVLIKPRMNQKIANTEKTNADRIINQEGIVLTTIDPLHNLGQVKVKGQVWSASSYDDQIIPKDSLVIVREIKGVKVIVEVFSKDTAIK